MAMCVRLLLLSLMVVGSFGFADDKCEFKDDKPEWKFIDFKCEGTKKTKIEHVCKTETVSLQLASDKGPRTLFCKIKGKEETMVCSGDDAVATVTFNKQAVRLTIATGKRTRPLTYSVKVERDNGGRPVDIETVTCDSGKIMAELKNE